GTSRHDAGLLAGGPQVIITDLAELGFDPKTRRMRIEALHPGVAVASVQANTGFTLDVAPDLRVTEDPKPAELATLRELDPDRLYIA
ncbi:MAG: hypothetical protein ACREFO_12810, partial [Acetobacteraceae bacterium]